LRRVASAFAHSALVERKKPARRIEFREPLQAGLAFKMSAQK
jgi:hypothetical protein